MDRWQAQYSLWSSYGVEAYEENSVPDLDDLEYPYITYQAVSAGFDGDTMPSVSIWSRSSSWADADALADAIEADIGMGGKSVMYEGGMLWVTANAPFAQSMGDPDDDLIKRKLLSVVLHFV